MTRIALWAALAAAGLAVLSASHGEATGRPHVCSYYTLKSPLQGTTVVIFRVLVNGKIGDIKVARSSGDAKVDSVSLQCAAMWRYLPAMKDGVPVEVPWLAVIAWRPQIPPTISERLALCGYSLRDVARRHPSPPRLTALSITAEGMAITAASVSQSSGDEALDRAAVECVGGNEPKLPEIVVVNADFDWHKPATVNASIDWQALLKDDSSHGLEKGKGGLP